MNRHLSKQLAMGLCILVGWGTLICAQSGMKDVTEPRKAEKVWRGGWALKEKDPQALIDTAAKLGFSSLIIHAGDDFAYLEDLCRRAREVNIDVYYWHHIIGTEKNKDWWQVVSPEEAEKAKRIKEDKEPGKHGYQYGGEPVNDQTDVFEGELLCFHRPEVVDDCGKKLETVLEKCPGLAGIAFDYYGYKNYHCCHCPVSEKMFEEYFAKFPEGKLARGKALEQFSLDTLVDFNNRLAERCRKFKPGIKIATHVYPTFLGNPVYGNRLDVDYCMQTVAWFFEPFWDLAKVEKYTRDTVQGAKRYFARPQGIPFVGIFMDSKDPRMDKPIERFREELKTIRKTGSQSFGICPFNIFIKHPELGDVLIEELGIPNSLNRDKK
jgi:hypothetical protein